MLVSMYIVDQKLFLKNAFSWEERNSQLFEYFRKVLRRQIAA